MTAVDDPLDLLLAHLKQARGFDFTGYKRSTMERRIARRMEEVGAADYLAYLDHLQVEPDEFGTLFNTILINVTGFFRDKPAWDCLRGEIVPKVVEDAGERPIRVWSAGCAGGPEAYSLAMAFAEELGVERFREQVKIYATDVDNEALAEARAGSFSAKAIESVPEDLQARYFRRTDQRFTFSPELRRTLIFGRNDLVQDAPISRVDLLSCRNTLMYFNAETQLRILGRFHFALRDSGFLFLGKSEMLITRGELFKPYDLKRRIFTKVPRATLRDRLLGVTDGDRLADSDTSDGTLASAVLDAAPIAQIAVGNEGDLALANRSAREMFGLREADVGRPIQDLELSYRPLDLRTLMAAAQSARGAVTADDVSFGIDGDQRTLSVTASPLPGAAGDEGVFITFADVTAEQRLRAGLEHSNRELENAYEELQSTVEELETTNEELQSTNEELETTNEEFQSTNEELETMNEELQSTNEELETTNEELRSRTTELDEVNILLETILTSLSVSVVVVDHALRIRVWNAYSEEAWGLRAPEVEGKPIGALDSGLPTGELRALLLRALSGETADGVTVEAVNRRGRTVSCRLGCFPLPLGSDDGGDVTGAIALIELRDGAGRDGAAKALSRDGS